MSGAGLKHQWANGFVADSGPASLAGAICPNIDNVSKSERSPPSTREHLLSESAHTGIGNDSTLYGQITVVDVDETAIQTIGEETRDEQRQIADFSETVALTAAAGLQRAGEADTERLFARRGRSIEVDKTGEQVDPRLFPQIWRGFEGIIIPN